VKTFTQVVLPLAALAGLVAGITFILNYTSPDPQTKDKKGEARVALKFSTTVAAKNQEENEQDVGPGERAPALFQRKYWLARYEPGEPGHFDFWFVNANDQPVRTMFTKPSCKCAGADLGVVPPGALANYCKSAALAGWASAPAGLLISAEAAAELASKIQWETLVADDRSMNATIPAASAQGAQLGIFRLRWSGQGQNPGPMSIRGALVAHMGQDHRELNEVEVKFNVFPPLNVFTNSGKGIILPELGADSAAVEQSFYVVSNTRSEMSLTLTPRTSDNIDALISCSKPVRLNADDIDTLKRQFPEAADALSVYKVVLTVAEHKEVEHNGKKLRRQLDLGPFDFALKVECAPRTATEEPKSVNVPVSGIVRGDVQIIGNQSRDRIDFGPPFANSENRSTEVTLISDRPGLDLEVDELASTPEFLKPQLESIIVSGDKKQWRLRVTIPAGKLYSTLNDAYVVLKTKDVPSRRVRIPVKAQAFDGGQR
jgi:hypothetical protein